MTVTAILAVTRSVGGKAYVWSFSMHDAQEVDNIPPPSESDEDASEGACSATDAPKASGKP